MFSIMNPTSYPITEDECVNGPGFVMNKDEEQMFCKKKIGSVVQRRIFKIIYNKRSGQCVNSLKKTY